MKRSIVIGALALALAFQTAAAQEAQQDSEPRPAAGVADESVLVGAAVLAPLLIGAALAAGKGGGGGGAAVGTITGGTPTTTPSTTGTN